MASVPPFYCLQQLVYHSNDCCPQAKTSPASTLRVGTGAKVGCLSCRHLTKAQLKARLGHVRRLIIMMLLVLCTHVILAQSPVRGLPRPDSIWLVKTTPKLYDFYYSAKQADHYEQISIASYAQQDRIKKNRFRDKTYTEVVAKGQKEPANYDDYVLIGSGAITEAKPNGDWE